MNAGHEGRFRHDSAAPYAHCIGGTPGVTSRRIAVLDLRSVAVRMSAGACTLCLLAATSAFAALTPDLTITKTHVGNFTQSQNQATYTITISNLGPGDVQSGNTVTVTDTMPGGLTATSISGSAWSCAQPSGPCTRDFGNTVLAAGSSYPPLTLAVNVAPNAPASVTNSVTVSGGGELNTANNAASDPTTIGPGPDLTISKTHVGNFTQSQNQATYTITVSNVGAGAAQSGNSVTVTDTMPGGLTATSISGSAWSCAQPSGPCTRDFGNTVLAAGSSYPPLTLAVNVAPNAPASVTNSVTVSGGGELNTANNAASDPTTIGPGPDLTISQDPRRQFHAKPEPGDLHHHRQQCRRRGGAIGQLRHRHRHDARRAHRDVDQRLRLELHATVRAVYPRLRQHGARRRVELSAAHARGECRPQRTRFGHQQRHRVRRRRTEHGQ